MYAALFTVIDRWQGAKKSTGVPGAVNFFGMEMNRVKLNGEFVEKIKRYEFFACAAPTFQFFFILFPAKAII